jgi:hypothetical protein
MFKRSKDGTSVVKGIGDDLNKELDLDVIQTGIVLALHQFGEARVMQISKYLEDTRKTNIPDAAIYSTLDKLEALKITARRSEPVNIQSFKVTKNTFCLTDRMAKFVKESI